MANNKFLSDAKNAFKQIQKELISKEEEEVMQKIADRLNISYESDKLEEEKAKKKKIKRSITLDEESLTFANQTQLLRAILSNDMAKREGLTEFIKNLIKEEWKRLFTTYENIRKDIENEEKNNLQ
jgi:hypothetical protein